MIVAVIFFGFLTFMGFFYLGINPSTIFMGVLVVLCLYIIIKVAMEKRPKLKK
jgi:hypothetical protein